jgi:rubrerythrin
LKGGSELDEKGVTASTIISFAKKLEEESFKFYKQMAEKYTINKDLFLSFSEECRKTKSMLITTYEETISDALEACFVKGVDLSDYVIEATITNDTDYLTALNMAIKLEETASKFYFVTAEQSEYLLATISRALRKIAEIRSNRKNKLKSLL